MPIRRKRSVSIAPDLDAEIESAATASGMTYSAWLAAAARTELIVRAGLRGVEEFEREDGSFTEAELKDAEEWARGAIERSRRSGSTKERLIA